MSHTKLEILVERTDIGCIFQNCSHTLWHKAALEGIAVKKRSVIELKNCNNWSWKSVVYTIHRPNPVSNVKGRSFLKVSHLPEFAKASQKYESSIQEILHGF